MVLRNGTSDPDTLAGGADNDRIYGRDGDDTLYGLHGDDLIVGGAGNDSMIAEWGNDSLYGGIGNDRLSAGGGLDLAYGGAGDDLIQMNDINYGGLTTAFGGSGNDAFTLFDSSGGTIDGGAGIDLLWLATVGSTGLLVDFAAGIVTEAGGFGGGVTWSGIERLSVLSYQGDDTILAGDHDDHLSVGGGVNLVQAYGGNDTVGYMVGWASTLHGGDGDDRLVIQGVASALNFLVDLLDGSVSDGYGAEITGFESFDARGSWGNDAVSFGNRGDRLVGGHGNDTALGMGGSDELNGQRGADLLYGGDGHDHLRGGWEDDVLYGDDGRDRLKGGLGNDLVYGGAGNDRIVFFLGNDTVTGGEGQDAFCFARNQTGFHTITDFESGTDRLVFTALYLPLAPDAGPLDPARLAYGTATGSQSQFVLTYDATSDTSTLLWDTNGADPSGGAYALLSLTGQVSLVAADFLIV